MNPIIIQLKTEKAKLEKEYAEYKIKALRCINELQNANPFFGDNLELLNAEELEQSADELLLVKIRLKQLQENIKKIKTQLGEE